MFSLFPKNTDFGPKYADSINNITLLAKNFQDATKNWKNIQQAQKISEKLETEGDTIIKDIILSLNDSFITPFDREDMYNLASELDDVSDQINHTIHHLKIYGINKSRPHIDDFSELYLDMAEVFEKIIRHLFAKKIDQKELERLIILVGMLAAKGNSYYEQSLEKLFSTEKDAIEVIKWENIINDLKKITDSYKKAVRVIESIVMKVG